MVAKDSSSDTTNTTFTFTYKCRYVHNLYLVIQVIPVTFLAAVQFVFPCYVFFFSGIFCQAVLNIGRKKEEKN